MNIEHFYEINESLIGLSDQVKNSVIELGFSIRETGESVALVLNSFDAFSMLIGNVPEKIRNDYLDGKSTKFYVELESLNTDKVRIYTNYIGEGIELMGYYAENGVIYETKVYRFTDLTTSSIERYDSNMNLIDNSDFDTVVDLDQWTGSRRIIDISIENNYRVTCIKKTPKNQVYLLVRNNGVSQ
jgi:hypothetical protein